MVRKVPSFECLRVRSTRKHSKLGSFSHGSERLRLNRQNHVYRGISKNCSDRNRRSGCRRSPGPAGWDGRLESASQPVDLTPDYFLDRPGYCVWRKPEGSIQFRWSDGGPDPVTSEDIGPVIEANL